MLSWRHKDGCTPWRLANRRPLASCCGTIAVRRYLAKVAGPAGTLLLLDDLQWAGADALGMLAVLLRAETTAPLRVIGAYRDTEVRPRDPLGVLLADLAQAGLAAHHSLQPLSLEETACLLDLLLEDGAQATLREQALRQAGGIPFFVVSCTQELRLADGARAEYATPWNIRQSVRQRVAALPELMQEVLDAAAVLGSVAQPALLTMVTNQTDQDVAAALAEACRVRLLEEQADAYRFAHDVIQEVVEGDLPTARRRLLHRRVAEALERHPGAQPVAVLAYHCSRGGDQEKTARYLEQAGDQAVERVAHAAAVSQYREAVEQLDTLGHRVDAARVRAKLGVALRSMGHFDEALTVLDQAAEMYRAGNDLESLGLVLVQGALLYRRKGSVEEAIARLQAHEELLQERGLSRARGLVCTRLATLLAWQGHYSAALAAAEQAATMARATGDKQLLAMAENRRADVLRLVGHFDEAQAVYEATIPLAEAIGHVESLCEMLTDLASIEVLRGQFARCRIHIDRALAISEDLGEIGWIGLSIALHGVISFWTCDWVQARKDAEQALALIDLQLPIMAAVPHWALGQLCFGEGRWAEATEHLEDSVRLAESSGLIIPLRMAQGVLAELDLLQERPREARARLMPHLDPAALGWKDAGFLVAKLAWAHLELGDLDQATELVEQAIRHARAKDDRLNLVEALRVEALVAQRQKQWGEAARALEEALAVAQSIGFQWGEARVLHLYGQLHRQQGELGPARARLEAALAIFQRLGARKDIERAEQDLAALHQLPNV